ncbi:MAG TPA: NHL repeat-containing protein, partial [Chthoniobacterales bacterium]
MITKNRFLSIAGAVAAIFLPATGFAAAGYLYESDFSTGSIYQLTTNAAGTVKVKFASGLDGVRGLAFDRHGNLFVGQSETIIKIRPDGFTSLFASNIHGPNFLAFDRAENLYVGDRDGNILRYTPQGASSVFKSGLNKPTGLAFDAFGNLYVADAGSNAIYKITPAGALTTFALNMKNPQGLAFDRTGLLYAVNQGNGTIEVFNSLGSRAIRVSGLASPVGIAFDKDNNLFVADNCNGSGTNSVYKFTGATVTGEVFASGLGCPLQLAFEPPRDPLFNISTRARVEAITNHELIGGFIITGNEPKTVLLRALGPSLSKSGVITPLMDPTLELHVANAVVANDNWMDTQKDEIIATGLAPNDDRESAILITLDPGAYTAIVRGKAPFLAGIAVVEVFDANLAADSSLSNISSRGYVQSGDNRMIAGVTIGGGNGAGKILIRGLGPSLAEAGIPDPLPDPTLTLNNANGTPIATNDDWAATQAYE